MRQEQSRGKTPAARILSLALALCMIAAFVPAFTLTVGAAATYSTGDQVTVDGAVWQINSDNLIYNGDMSETTTGSDGYTYVTGWTGGYVNTVLQPLSTAVVSASACTEDSHFTYTAASEDTSAYITTADGSAARSSTAGWTTYMWSPSDGYGYSTINNWFVDSNGSYITAESGKTYYMSFKMKISATGTAAAQYVSFGAFTQTPSSYTNALPGRFDTSLTSALDDWIQPYTYVSETEKWVTVEAVGTATTSGYFAFQSTWAQDYGSESFTDFELYEVVTPTTSSADTVQEALASLSVPEITKADFTLDTTTKDSVGTDLTVNWASELESVLSVSGGTVTYNSPDELTNVTLTATADGWEGVSATYTVVVLPESYAVGDTYGNYTVKTLTADMSNVTWTHRESTTDTQYDAGIDETVTDNGLTYVKFKYLGGKSYSDGNDNARASIAIAPGSTYLLRFYYGGAAVVQGSNDGGNTYKKVYTTAAQYADETAIDYVVGTASSIETTNDNEWTMIEKVFTASDTANYLTFVYSWQAAGLIIADIQLVELTKTPADVTIEYVYDETVLKSISASDTVYVGESYTYTPTDDDAVLTIDETTYVLDTTSSTLTINSLSATASDNIIKLSYTQDTPAKVEDLTLTTRVGVKPDLPETVTVIGTSENELGTMNVSWNTDENDYATLGQEYTVTGWLTNFDTISVTAKITVVEVDSYLVARYEFESDGTNSEGSNYTATLGDNIEISSDSVSGSGAAYFPGYTSSGSGSTYPEYAVTIEDNLLGDSAIQASSEVTISAFVKPESDMAYWERLFDFGNATSGTDLFYSVGSGIFQLEGEGTISSAALTSDVWTHVAMTIDSKGNATLYVNGENKGTATTFGSFTDIGKLTSPNYYIGASNWADALFNGWVDDFRVYSVALTQEEVDALAAVVEVNYTVDGTVMDDLTYITATAIDGSVTTAEVSGYVYGGSYYNAVAKTEENISENTTVTVALEAATDKYAPTSNFSYHFGTNEVIWAGDHGYSSSTKYGTISIGWDASTGTAGLRETIMTFDVGTTENKLLTGAVLNLCVGYAPASTSNYYVYAIDPSYVNISTENPGMNTTETWTTSQLSDAVAAMGGYTDRVGSASVSQVAENGTKTWVQITLDLSGVDTSSGEVAFLIYSPNQIYTETIFTDNAPYLSDLEYTDSVSYTVKYVADGVEIAESTTYSTTSDYIYGYNNTVTCSYVPIPSIGGYIFTSKEVSDKTITLTYTSVESVDGLSNYDGYFFNNVENDTTLVSLNMLGAHDAFTVGMDSDNIKYDAASVKQNNSLTDNGAVAALAEGSTFASTAVSQSKTQDKTALELLEAGVRYFDVRLSRSDTEGTYLLFTAPDTNGVFYTTHGILGDEFRPIAYTIGQWLDAHPGEVIILDFQEAYDYMSTNGSDGNSNSSTWTDINAILTEAGINKYAIDNSAKMKEITYGDLTSDGTSAGVLLFGRATATNAGIGEFYLRGTTSDAFGGGNGYLYSNYDHFGDDDVEIGSTYDPDYIQAQVDHLIDYNNGDGDSYSGDTSGDHAVYHMVRVMQAQSDSTDLITQASSDNTSIYNALISESTTDYNYSEWLTALPIIMVNAAGTNTNNIVTLLHDCNVEKDITVNYTIDGTTMTKTEQLMVGTIYVKDQYAIVHDDTNGNYYVTDAYTTKPSTSTAGDVTYVPYTTGELTIPVTALEDDIYTVTYDTIVYGTTSVSDGGVLYSSESSVGAAASTNPAFAAYKWGDGIEDPDRVGFAIVHVDEKEATQQYTFNVTESGTPNGSSLVTYFYVVDKTTFDTVDISDSEAVKKLFDNDALIATYTNSTSTLKSDTTLLEAYEGEDVVIVGTSTDGLYGLSAITIGITTKDLGVEIIDGAQIRVGEGVDNTGEALADIEKSGLRFIAKLTKEGTLVADADPLSETNSNPNVGIAIFNGGFGTTAFDIDSATIDDDKTADATLNGSKAVVMIPAETYQNDPDNTIFTAAITNIQSTNYNRIYVAVPYVVVGDTYYYDWDAAVARTPYQVAAGILVSQNVNNETSDYTYTEANQEVLVDVLNVYTNQTGARITITGDLAEGAVGEADYANGAKVFFEASDAVDDDGNYVITLTASGNAKFNSDATSYYRVNNARDDFVNYYTNLGRTVDFDIAEDGSYMKITIYAAAE